MYNQPCMYNQEINMLIQNEKMYILMAEFYSNGMGKKFRQNNWLVSIYITKCHDSKKF